jgi:hypothetical protein
MSDSKINPFYTSTLIPLTISWQHLAVFTFGGSCPALTAHGSLDHKQEIQIQISLTM